MNSIRVKKAIGIAVLIIASVLFGVYFRKILGFGVDMIGLFMPFILGFLFAVLTNPLAEILVKRFKLPRNVSAVIVMLIFLGVIGGIVTYALSRIITEIQKFVSDPAFIVNIQNTFDVVSGKLTGVFEGLPVSIKDALSDSASELTATLSEFVSRESTSFFRSAGNIVKRIPGIFVASIVFLLSYFFILSDAPRIKDRLKRFLSGKTLDRIRTMKAEVKKSIGGYIKAQLIIMSVAFVILSVGFSIMGIKYAIIIAFLTAILDAFPFFGSGAVLWPWAVVSLISADYKSAVGFVIIYLCVIFTRQMIEPKIVSHKLGMNSLLILASMYVGYRLFSIGGMILGPLTVMLFISIKRAGFFDDIIEIFKLLKRALKREFLQFKNNLRSDENE